MKADRIVGILYGAITAVLVFFLFDFHIWQSLIIAWLVGSLFSFLTGIYLAVKGPGDVTRNSDSAHR